MSTMSHTPEPWVAHKYTAVAGGRHLFYGSTNPLHEGEENIQRAVDCVNGCKGIYNPETTVPELLDFIKAAEGALANRGDHGNEACAGLAEQARALLANVKLEQQKETP